MIDSLNYFTLDPNLSRIHEVTANRPERTLEALFEEPGVIVAIKRFSSISVATGKVSK